MVAVWFWRTQAFTGKPCLKFLNNVLTVVSKWMPSSLLRTLQSYSQWIKKKKKFFVTITNSVCYMIYLNRLWNAVWNYSQLMLHHKKPTCQDQFCYLTALFKFQGHLKNFAFFLEKTLFISKRITDPVTLENFQGFHLKSTIFGKLWYALWTDMNRHTYKLGKELKLNWVVT